MPIEDTDKTDTVDKKAKLKLSWLKEIIRISLWLPHMITGELPEMGQGHINKNQENVNLKTTNNVKLYLR